jgi:hypothetical protein
LAALGLHGVAAYAQSMGETLAREDAPVSVLSSKPSPSNVARAQPIGETFAREDAAMPVVSPVPSAPSDIHSRSKRFFVEFRARNAASYGHMYVMYGEVNERREIIRSEIAGLFPAGDGRDCENCSVYNWTVGHVVPVTSEIGVSDGDLEEQYVLARYRVWIDAAQYKSLVAYIKERKAHLAPWHAFLNNCVTFGRDVAVFLHLNVPPMTRIAPSVVMYPQTLVESIRDANGGPKDQGPLKDAPGSLPAEIMAKLNVAATKKAANPGAKTSVKTASGIEQPPVPKKRPNRPEINASAIH